MRTAITTVALGLTILLQTAAGQDIRTSFRPENDSRVTSWLDEHLSELVGIYRDLHAHPELSWEEIRTAKTLSDALRQAGYEVASDVGRTGVVGILKNGDGPTLLIRGDMDALPVTEETGLEYASKVVIARPGGATVGVMHACGHDIHTTSLIGTARLLAGLRDRWSGSLLIVGQPAEELGQGAKAMIEDGLFERFGRPDYCIAFHVSDNLPAGRVGYTAEWAFANVDSVDITIYGRGGHGARPHDAVDPIIASAHLITALQTLVSRRVSPTDTAVVTVGSIQGGSKHNIIPSEVSLQLTVRSYSDEVRKQLLDGIRQIAVDTARTFGCPKPPTVSVRDEFTPSLYNDPALATAAAGVFRQVFGAESVIELPPTTGGEDFSQYMRALKVPGLMFRVGTISAEAYRRSLEPGGAALPSLHSGHYAPLPEPSIHTGIRATVHLALALLGSE